VVVKWLVAYPGGGPGGAPCGVPLGRSGQVGSLTERCLSVHPAEGRHRRFQGAFRELGIARGLELAVFQELGVFRELGVFGELGDCYRRRQSRREKTR
jgi:hypothetical protein